MVQYLLFPYQLLWPPLPASEKETLGTKAWENDFFLALDYLGHLLPFHGGKKGRQL